MRSIRRSLTTGLLAGLLLLWLAAGAGVYLSVKRSLLKSIDAELAVDARAIRFTSRGENTDEGNPVTRFGAQRVRERAPDYHVADGKSFYQIWDSRGEEIEKSKSLGDLDLGFPEDSSSTPVFGSGALADGRDIRTMTYRASSGGKGKGRRGVKVTILAKEVSSVKGTLSSVLGGVVLTGILAGFGTLCLVQMVLHRGLKPLEHLGDQTLKIDLSSTESQFDNSAAPLELQPVYNRLNELLARLSASFERERQFGSDLAHEMRTPVSELKMMTEIALKWPDQSGEKTHVETLDIALQLERIIESLLMLGRVEAGQVQLNLEPLNATEFILTKWQSFKKQVEAKDLMVEIETDDSLVWSADANLLDHTLSNLFANAVEYTKKGDTIRIATEGGQFKITNPAPLLKPADIDHLFDRLWRADESRTDSTHSGIGLSLARNCAEIQGFDLSAKLESGNLEFTLKKRA